MHQLDKIHKELWGKETGTDSDNLTNSERMRRVLHLLGAFVMRSRDLRNRFGLCRSTFYHNVKRLGEVGRDRGFT